MPIIAMMAPIIPNRTLLHIKGRRIKDLVAPTICMVFIVKRFAYTERRIELLINKTAINRKTLLIINIQKLISFTFSESLAINGLS